MAVTALKPGYKFEPLDLQKNFHGNQLTYVGWDHHLMFCAPFCYPVPPTLTFKELRDNVMAEAFSAHPMFNDINWDEAAWLLDGKPFTPKLDAGLAEQGVGHKSVLRFQTPDRGYQNAGV